MQSMKISVMTLGCKVNKYESDSIIYKLNLKGFETTDKLEFADIYLINTCAVTQEAEKKSRQMIARCRKFNKNAKIVIMGCASQNNFQQFVGRNVDYIIGVANKIHACDIIESIAKSDQLKVANEIFDLPSYYEDDMHAFTTRVRAYIKIQDGCNNFCTYCIIPYLRGRSRSREIFSIINEVSSLDDEIKEIVLTGIDVADYKIDGKPSLALLLKELDTFQKRLRLSSFEEGIIDEEFLKSLANLDNFCPHFHLSLQSGSDSVLKRMNRHYTTSQFLNSINLIRKYFPSSAITTDVIVGFPEETEEEFNETVEFIKKANFARLHVFKYSNRTGTVASKMFKDCSPQVKENRSQILLKLSEELHRKFISQNKEGKVLIEEKEGDYFVGYTENYIKCYIKSDKVSINQIVKVKIKKPYLDGAEAKVIK